MKNIQAIVFSLLVAATSAASAQEKIPFPVGASSKTLGYSHGKFVLLFFCQAWRAAQELADMRR